MKRINGILKDPDFINYLNKNIEAEADRIFCRHDMAHFLDVARIARILSIEKNLDINKELLYAAGLLHDIGRWMEYESGEDHAEASKELAQKILARHGFTKEEKKEILNAIEDHRKGGGTSILADLLYRADKYSRNCALCDAKTACKKFQNGETFFLYY